MGGGAAGGPEHRRDAAPHGERLALLSCLALLSGVAGGVDGCWARIGGRQQCMSAAPFYSPPPSHVRSTPLQAPLKAGEKCLAQSASDKQWYRASVEKAYAADPVSSVDCLVMLKEQLCPDSCKMVPRSHQQSYTADPASTGHC